jgi:nucleoside-diphosphate-sugar epimerase
MKCFITGGTGFIGSRLTERLISANHTVTLLVRNHGVSGFAGMEKAAIVTGDIFNVDALREGMRECDCVFHMAAFTKPWSDDPSLVTRTNVTGTVNILETALECKVRKVVITSTGGTMGYSCDGKSVGEKTNSDPVFNTLYEKSKAEAEKVAIEFSNKGLNVSVVNPTRVYGPGKLTKSNSMTRIIRLYISGLWRILPGDGESAGNYVFIDDVVEGHILAATKGKPGERYILGGENLSFRELFAKIGEEAGQKRALIPLPAALMEGIVNTTVFFSKITGRPPLITRDWLDKYLNDWIMSSKKAESELGYTITPFSQGVAKTIEWLKTEQNGIRK